MIHIINHWGSTIYGNPHMFIIWLRVKMYTTQEEAALRKRCHMMRAIFHVSNSILPCLDQEILDIYMISIWYLYDLFLSLSLAIYIYISISDLNVSISADPYHVGRVSKDFQGTEAKPWFLYCQAQSQRWTWLEEVPVGGCLGTRHEFGIYFRQQYTSDLRVVQS